MSRLVVIKQTSDTNLVIVYWSFHETEMHDEKCRCLKFVTFTQLKQLTWSERERERGHLLSKLIF